MSPLPQLASIGLVLCRCNHTVGKRQDCRGPSELRGSDPETMTFPRNGPGPPQCLCLLVTPGNHNEVFDQAAPLLPVGQKLLFFILPCRTIYSQSLFCQPGTTGGCRRKHRLQPRLDSACVVISLDAGPAKPPNNLRPKGLWPLPLSPPARRPTSDLINTRTTHCTKTAKKNWNPFCITRAQHSPP